MNKEKPVADLPKIDLKTLEKLKSTGYNSLEAITVTSPKNKLPHQKDKAA